MTMKHTLCATIITLSLAACGSGGGGSPEVQPAPTPTPNTPSPDAESSAVKNAPAWTTAAIMPEWSAAKV